MRNLWCFLLLCAAGCSAATATPPEDKSDRDHARAVAAADFVFAEAAAPAIDPAKDCKCGGTKIIKVQDGNNVRRVACPCGDSCKCVKTPGAGPLTKLRYYGDSKTCAFCKLSATNGLDVLVQAGWDVGDTPDHQIQLVTVRLNDAATQKKHSLKSLPTFEVYQLLPDGTEKVLRREEGFLNFVGIGELRDLKPISAKGRDQKLKWDGQKTATSLPSPEGDAAALVATVAATPAVEPLAMGPIYFQIINKQNYHTTVEHLMSEDHPFHAKYTLAELTPYAHDQDALNRIHGYAHTGQIVAYATKPINSTPTQFKRQH